MSAGPVYAPPADVRTRLERIAATEKRLTERERELGLDARALEERAATAEAKLRDRTRKAKAAGARLAELHVELNQRQAELTQAIQEAEAATYLVRMPGVHGGPEGLYAASEEAKEHERRKKRARRTGQ